MYYFVLAVLLICYVGIEHSQSMYCIYIFKSGFTPLKTTFKNDLLTVYYKMFRINLKENSILIIVWDSELIFAHGKGELPTGPWQTKTKLLPSLPCPQSHIITTAITPTPNNTAKNL